MSALDPFALGGRQDDVDDAAILAMFRRWIAEQRACDAIAKATPPHMDAQDNPVWVAASDAIEKLEDDLLAIPCAGAVGLAVKGYVGLFDTHSGFNGDAAAIWPGTTLSAGEIAFLRDAARIVPEIAALAEPVLTAQQEA